MVRAVLVSVLAAVALAPLGGCKSAHHGPRVAPGTPVGKVIELEGTATATRDGTARPLKENDEVSPDDIVASDAAGSVKIQLFHNRAVFELNLGASTRVDRAGAWDLTAEQVAQNPGEHYSAAAGRNAERTAASDRTTAAPGATAVQATTPPPPPPPEQPITPPIAPPIAPADPSPPKTEVQQHSRRGPPAATATATATRAQEVDDAAVVGGEGAATREENAKEEVAPVTTTKSSTVAGPSPDPKKKAKHDEPDGAAGLTSSLDGQATALRGCLPEGTTSAVITIDVSGGATTVSSKTLDAKALACVRGVVGKLHVDAVLTTKLTFTVK